MERRVPVVKGWSGGNIQPAFGGVELAILFDLPVLRHDELRSQRHPLGVARAHDHRRDGAVEMRGLAARVLKAGTTGAVDVFGLGGKIPGRIQGDETGAVHRAHGLQHPGLVEGLVEIIEEAEEMTRLHRGLSIRRMWVSVGMRST